jgi:hypothetical protein
LGTVHLVKGIKKHRIPEEEGELWWMSSRVF